MEHQRQPQPGRGCGVTCVAMLAGIGVVRAFQSCGGQRWRANALDLRLGLAGAGYRLEPFEPRRELPATGRWLVRVRHDNLKTAFHWIVCADGRVFDPLFTASVDRDVYARFLARHRGHVISGAAVVPLGTGGG